MRESFKKKAGSVDPFTTIVPFLAILLCCIYFMVRPAEAAETLGKLRTFLGEEFGVYYLAVGLLVFFLSLYIACSRYGKIRLGGAAEKPRYSNFSWGAMMFTSGLAADILFYSLCEWISYANENYLAGFSSREDFASVMPLFHWGPIPWGFYAILAACFGFMLHVRGQSRRKYSEACRPILGAWTDRAPGKCIDVLAVFALLAGTATTFAVATPLLSGAILRLCGLPAGTNTRIYTIAVLLIICAVYTITVMRGMKGVQWLAKSCMYLFFALLAFVFFLGGESRYILETGFSAIGNLAQNFIYLSTRTDPLRETHFPQNWTIFYWAYWMVWCVAAPFFMGSISRGRTVRAVILGAYAFGLSSTLLSFIILGNYSLGLTLHGVLDVAGLYAATGSMYETVLTVLGTLPCPALVLLLLIASMVAFYATSFDSITLVAAAYSYRNRTEQNSSQMRNPANSKKLNRDQKQIKNENEREGQKQAICENCETAAEEEQYASPAMKLFWAILLIMLPVALVFSDSSMQNLQTVSIIAAFPIALVILLIIASFLKDGKAYMEELEEQKEAC